MTAARIMHVDDEPDIREVVRISLERDPGIKVLSCASGAEALAAVDDWSPDLVLLDVMMPNMDGPTTLTMLRRDPATASIPVVFMTARVQTRELDHFKSLGAAGVLPKPFDPSTLVSALRGFLRPEPTRLDVLQTEFLARARNDARELAGCKAALAADRDAAGQRARVVEIAHGLAGAGGIFGYRIISKDAAALEELLITDATASVVGTAIDTLLESISATGGDRIETRAEAGASPSIAAAPSFS